MGERNGWKSLKLTVNPRSKFKIEFFKWDLPWIGLFCFVSVTRLWRDVPCLSDA